MSLVVYVSADNSFETRLDEVLGYEGSPRQRWQDEYPRIDPTKVVDACGRPGVEVVCLGPGLAPETALGLAEAFDRDRPEIYVLLLAEPTAELYEAALRTGARDVVSPDADAETLRGALHRAAQVAERRRQHTLDQAASRPVPADATRVITVLSPKGGTGKTTIATNLAVGLSRAHPGSTVLVDLDLQFGDVATALRLVPTQSMSDVARAPSNLDATMLKVFLTPHSSGLFVLCAPDSPAEADDISAAHATTAIGLLRAEFRFVIIDTGSGLGDHDLAAIELSTDLVFVGSMDVPGVRSLRKELDILDQLGLAPAKRHLVLNRVDSKVGMDTRDIEGLLDMPIDVAVPSSWLVPLSTNEGEPLLEGAGRSPVARALAELVGRFSDSRQPETGPTTRRRRGRGRKEAS